MSREFVATVNETEVSVRIQHAGSTTWTATVAGEPVPVDAQALGQGAYSLRIGNRSYYVIVDSRPQGMELSVQGSRFRVGFEDATLRAVGRLVKGRSQGASGDEAVRAPIAGRVVKLLCAVGQTMERGDGVIVVEAMKMENEIRSERGGRVERIHVEPGAPIESGQLLVTLKRS